MRFRTKRPVVALFLGLSCLCLAPAAAADDPLALVPRGAWGIVFAPRLGEAETTLQRLGRQLQLPLPPDLFKMAGIQDGLNRQGAALAIVMPRGDEKRPAVIVALPASDYDQLLKSFHRSGTEGPATQIQIRDRTYLVAPKGKFAVFAEPQDRAVLERVLKAGEAVPGNLRGLQPWLARHAVGLVVTRPGIEAAMAAAMEGLETMKATMIEAARSAEPDTEAGDKQEKKEGAQASPRKVPSAAAVEQAAQGIDIYMGIARFLEREVRTTAGAVRLDERGTLRVEWRTRFKPDGEVARVLADVKPAEEDLLAGLPAEPFVFAAGGVLSPELSEAMMDWSVKMMRSAPGMYGITPEQADKMAKVAKESMGSLRGMAMLWGVGKAREPLYANFLAAMRVDEAEKFLGDYSDYIRKLNEIIGDRPSMMSNMEVEKAEVAGRPGLKLSMDTPRMPNAEQIPNYDRMMELMFGPGDKITAYLAAVDERTVVGSYVNRRLVERTVEAAKKSGDGLIDREEVAKAAARLPKQAAWRLYFSPAGMTGFVNRVLAVSLPEGAPRIELPDFPETPPIAWAGSTGKAEFREHMVVPAEVLKAVVPYVEQVRQKAQESRSKKQAGQDENGTKPPKQ